MKCRTVQDDSFSSVLQRHCFTVNILHVYKSERIVKIDPWCTFAKVISYRRTAGVTHSVVCLSVCLSICLQVSGVITDSAGVVRYVLSGTWDSKMEGANVLNGDDANMGKVEYITGQSKVLWQRRFPPYVTACWLLLVALVYSSLQAQLLMLDVCVCETKL